MIISKASKELRKFCNKYFGELQLYVLVLAAFTGTAMLWVHYQDIENLTIDDAFISFRYAKNLINGHGLVYNIGAYTEGYTNFFWTVLAAVAIGLGIEPQIASLYLDLLSLIAFASTLVVLFVSSQKEGMSLRSLFPALLLGFSCFLCKPFRDFIGSGMETLLAAVSLFFYFLFEQKLSLNRLTAFFCTLLILLRPDLILLPAAVLIVNFYQGRHQKFSTFLRSEKHHILAFGIYAIWWFWKLHYYAGGVSNTYFAKGSDHYWVAAGIEYLKMFCKSFPQYLIVIVLLPFFNFRLRKPTTDTLYAKILLGTVLYALYLLKVGGDYMEFRFMYILFPLFALVIMEYLLTITRSVVQTFILLIFCAFQLWAPRSFPQQFGTQSIPQMRSYSSYGREIGKVLSGLLPGDTVIATTMAGALSYYSELYTIDLWGLTDSYIARNAPTPKLMTRGHLKYGADDYLRERGVNFNLRHPQRCSCDASCFKSPLNDVVFKLKEGTCVGMQYLKRSPKLSTLLCQSNSFLTAPWLDCLGETQDRKLLFGNSDFESGDFSNWTVTTEDASTCYAPTFGDRVAIREQGHSHQLGSYWLGSYEGVPSYAPCRPNGDSTTMTLLSTAFRISKKRIRFLYGQTIRNGTQKVELLINDTPVIVELPPKGAHHSEEMVRVIWDVQAYQNKMAKIRIVDNGKNSWEHVNVDDFSFLE